ncbi:hypothetical protein Ctob_015874, partial [Chrysochromulina tobinii]
MIPPTPVPILWVESLLLWNAAGWWSGDSEGGPDGQQATAASRYDVLDPLLRGPDAPTYIVLNEVSGSSRDSEHPRGLRAWLGKAGYGHQFYPGGSTTSQRSNGSSGATGGLLLAWLKCETTPCGKPEVDPVSMTIMVDFKHRRHAAASPPMRLVAAYGTQQRNGKSKALKTIIRHAMQSRGCLAAGDLNVTPDASWRCSRRRATAADDEFEAITGGGEAGDGTSMVGIVDLGLNHAQGQFSRAHWTDRLADGSPKGTATLDHVLVSGLERGSWTRRAVWHAFGDGGRLVSDHMLIIVERAPRCAPPDDSGVHRLPRYLVSKWKPHQVAAFTASFDLGLTQLRAGQWRPDSEGERQTLGRGADAIVQLVALLNAASAAAVVATRGDPLRDRLRRADAARAAAVVSRLLRDVSYYSQQLGKLERRADRPIWQGVADAAAGGGRDAIIAAMRRPTQHDDTHGGIQGLYRADKQFVERAGVRAPGEWITEPAAVRAEAGEIYRSIDDSNYGAGSNDARIFGFHAAMCPPPYSELPGKDGREWRLPDECEYADFVKILAKMHPDKATSLDRVSKEMLELLPDALRRPFYVAAMGVATPDAQGARHKPDYWARVPVKLLNKKVPSPVVSKKRDIGLTSQLLKLQAGLYMPAYAAVMDRLPGNFGWTPGVSARGAAICGGLVLDHAHLLSHLLVVVYGDIQRFFPSMDRGFVLISEQWRGLPRDVREATLALYDDACFLYETEHGLADGAPRHGGGFDFTRLRSKCGYFQGCMLSTEKAKIFMASLVEAID